MADYLQEDLAQISRDPAIDWQALDGSHILVTGATGLVGSLLVRSLLHRGTVRVTALVRSMEKAQQVFGSLCSKLQFVLSDVTKPFCVPEHIDYMIHGASITASRVMAERPVDTLMTAICGTQNLLELAVRHHIKSMVYISSMEVYGITDPEKACISETDLGYVDILKPRSSYPEGKRLCECMCASYGMQYGVPVKIARLAQTFGAGVSREENRVFAQFAKSALRGEDIILHTRGEAFGNYCYTADAVRGLLCILTRGQNGEAYTVVNEATTMQIRDMAKLVADRFSGGASQVFFDIPTTPMGYAPDSTMHLSAQKLRSLGWTPQYDLENMYRRMMGHWNMDDLR